MNILFVGDIFGESGREAFREAMASGALPARPDFVVVNGENAAGGRGLTFATADDMFTAGADGITLGNHTWARKEVRKVLDDNPRVIRPANYPKGVPGRGRMILEKKGFRLAVVNLLGRVTIDPVPDCPFLAADRELAALKGQADFVLVDMHAEATSEKAALAWYLDGRAGCVVGTHTHVQTADERILPKGTGFITDVGMTGPCDGIIGVDRETVIRRFLTGMSAQFEPAVGRTSFQAVLIAVDEKNGKTLGIERINRISGVTGRG